MNIMHIISAAASGGAEVYVKDLAKSLSIQGNNVHIGFLSTAADAGRDVKYEEVFLNDLKLSGVKVFVIGNETRKKPWLGISRVRRYVKKNRIEVCHTHLAYGIIFSALCGVPVVYTHHTVTPRWGKLTYALFNKLIDRYVGISEICAAALKRYTGREVCTIVNAVSEEKFSGYVRRRELGDIVNIAMIGRITVQKDYMNMMYALSLLDDALQKKIRINIAGEGDLAYKGEMLSYIRNNKLDGIVTLVGVQKNIPDFLCKADVFMMSSAWEGLPIALIEAAVSGLPCIVTDVGGCSEVIKTSKNGVVVAPRAPKELANALIWLLSNDAHIEELSNNAIKNSQYYSISTAAKLHHDLYLSVVR